MKTLSLVIPVFNESDNLQKLFNAIEKIRSEISAQSISLQVIIVDNSSTDPTWENLFVWAQQTKNVQIKLIRHPVNLGMQQSLLTGIKHSDGDCVAVMQSDLQDPPFVIVEMVNAWINGSTFVATRIDGRDGALLPRLGAWLFYRILSIVSDERIIRDSSDFYLFDSKMRKELISVSGTTPFIRAGLSAIREPDEIIKYKRKDRNEGSSNFNFSRRINFAMDALLRNLSGLVKKTIGFAGIMALISIFSLLWIAVSFLGGYRSPVSGWISTMVVLLIILSTTLSIGALALELLARIYRDMPRTDFSQDSEIVEIN